MKRIVLAAAVGALLVGGSRGSVPAFADGARERVQGTVQSVAGDQVIVRTANGEQVALTVSADTRYHSGNLPVGIEQVTVGARVSADVTRRDNRLHALSIRLVDP